MKDIPCIDFSLLAGKNLNEEEELDEDVKKICEEIVSGFSEIGFLYFKNHGLSTKLIEGMHRVGQEFFCLPEEKKMKYERDFVTRQGYNAINRELLDPSKEIQELRESFDITNLNGDFPSEVNDFKEQVSNLIEAGIKFSNKLLKCLELGLELPDGTLMGKHNLFSTFNNKSVFRILHYPPIPENAKDGLIRCGTHTDYGTFTLLFQDDMGGLEVRRRDGTWVNANPIPDTIIVNAGDLLQMWTADRLLATPHRVLVPKEEVIRKCSRRSAALFIIADYDVTVKPLDGSSSTYSPIGVEEYLNQRYKYTFSY